MKLDVGERQLTPIRAVRGRLPDEAMYRGLNAR